MHTVCAGAIYLFSYIYHRERDISRGARGGAREPPAGAGGGRAVAARELLSSPAHAATCHVSIELKGLSARTGLQSPHAARKRGHTHTDTHTHRHTHTHEREVTHAASQAQIRYHVGTFPPPAGEQRIQP